MNIPILFEDDALLVIDKPAGITVNKSETTKEGETVQEWALPRIEVPKVSKVPKVSNGGSNGSPFDTSDTFSSFDTFWERGGIVHRLDKETSGLLIIAKTPEAFDLLQKQFKERTIKKTYVALAHGKVEPEVGEISVPVGRLPWNRKRFGVIAGGRDSITKYKVLSIKYLEKEPLSLVELYPETGRTHQIRVHLKHINHPIFADFLYAGRKTSRDDRKFLNRVFLHAHKISFNHPITGEQLAFESPLPSELERFINSLATS